MDEFEVIEVTAENVDTLGTYCIRTINSPGNQAKSAWYKNEFSSGLRLFIALNPNGEKLGMVEAAPVERAWRPVRGKNYLFVHCLILFRQKHRHTGVGSALLQRVIELAREQNLNGVAAYTSTKPWMADSPVFEKNGFQLHHQKERFDLMVHSFNEKAYPDFESWEDQLEKYKGWNLIYSNQCPYHAKAAKEMQHLAREHNIDLKIKVISSPEEAQKAPTGFGTFSLIKDAEVLADHYISQTRFKNILRENRIIGQ